MRKGSWSGRWGRRAVAATGLVAGSVATIGAAGTARAASVLRPSSFVQSWVVDPVPGEVAGSGGNPIAESSPMIATLDGSGPAVVVGDRTGNLFAYHLADGTPVAGWPVDLDGQPIDSTPSVGPGPGGLDDVYVGTGNAARPDVGGYRAVGPDGRTLWTTTVQNPPDDLQPALGVQASLTVADLQGGTDVFAGSLGQEDYALDGASGQPLAGWPFFASDSDFSTAAAANLYGEGQDLVVGGAQTAGYALGQNYSQGGHLRILNSRGGLVCHYDTTEEVDSSPAVGAILAGGATGIVMGTGDFFAGASDEGTLQAFDTGCGRVWSDTLDGSTASSPALADVLGDGHLQVVEGTDNGSGGSVWVVDAADGSVIWHVPVVGRVIGSVVTADLSGAGYQDLLVPTTAGVEVLDGLSHQKITVLSAGGYQNAPLVTDDPDGSVGITIAGYGGTNQGVIFHYEIPGSNGAAAVGAGSWPMFHHDPQLSGVAGPITPAGPPCTLPAAAVSGYALVASDGGVFSYGRPFCGSTGNIRLNQPVVGTTMAPASGGYWSVASDGGIFAFGGAAFYGSTGNLRLNRPVVGMATTPDGRGYWMVASDGGIFAFGDAPYLGSVAGLRLPVPVVGMAASGDGQGYWIAAANGSVYGFGSAHVLGSASGLALARPIVAITADWATGGYWLVASDGGVFSYDAPFYGSTGNLVLNRPVVGMTATEDGQGYWMVASDGGVFSYGDAVFRGSTAGLALSRPVVALDGFSG